VRALSPEQHAALSALAGPDDLPDFPYETTPLEVIYYQLAERGCARITSLDGDWWLWEATPLGLLALRVARPEMSFALP
jgi:hypothetical protein